MSAVPRPDSHTLDSNAPSLLPRVLVVDDHADIRDPLATYLERHGLEVSTAATASQMRHLLQHSAFDLIVLDIMLPDEDGLSLCRHVTEALDTPIIFLTAMATSADRVRGLESGADDYVVKPFDPPELVARIRGVLRRNARGRATSPRAAASRFMFDGWVLDVARRQLRNSEGRDVPLSETEHQLLAALVQHPQTVLSRERLLDLTQRDAELGVFDRSVDTQVSRLRRKLEVDPRRPGMIKTAWGNGYLFTPTVHPLIS